MRFFNSVSELESALNTCAPLRSFFKSLPVYVRTEANRKAWVMEGTIYNVSNLAVTRRTLKHFATNVTLTRPGPNKASTCIITIHAANRHVFELILRKFRRQARMDDHNEDIKVRTSLMRLPTNYPLAPPERRLNSSAIRHYHRYGAYLVAMNTLPAEPFIAPQQLVKPVPAITAKTDNVTPFPMARAVKPSKTEKPGT